MSGENVLVDNSPSNEPSDVFCADQEQVINGMQENNTTTITTTTTPNNNQNIIDKHIRWANLYFFVRVVCFKILIYL